MIILIGKQWKQYFIADLVDLWIYIHDVSTMLSKCWKKWHLESQNSKHYPVLVSLCYIFRIGCYVFNSISYLLWSIFFYIIWLFLLANNEKKFFIVDIVDIWIYIHGVSTMLSKCWKKWNLESQNSKHYPILVVARSLCVIY